MNDRALLTEQLRADLDRLAGQAPLANPYLPPLERRPLELRPSELTRKPAPLVIAAALLAAALAAAVLVVIHAGAAHRQVVITDQPPGSVSVPTISPTSTTVPTSTTPPGGTGTTTLPQLLPASSATLQSIHEATAHNPPPAGSPYAQAFEGPAGPSTARLLITTEVAPAGALAGYASSGGQAITVAGRAGYLLTLSTHLQLLWQVPSGVVVSLEAINLDTADLTGIAALVQARPAAELGVDLTGPLPDGLAPVGSGSTALDGLLYSLYLSSITETFEQDGCQAILQIVPGSAADFDAIAITAGNGRSTTVGGRPGVIVDWGASDNNMVTVLWSYSPGVILRLQGDCSDIPTLAAQLHPVSDAVWDQAIASLGSRGEVGTLPPPPTAPPTSQPAGRGGYTFGLAH